MNGIGYLEKACLPTHNGKTETLASFSMRILTSRAPNLLPPGPFVLDKITNEYVVVMVAGVPEGKVLLFDAEQANGPLNVSVGADQFVLRGSDPANRYDGCTHKDLIDRNPEVEPILLDRTTTLLGEMGLYSGIDTSWWRTVQE